MEKVKKLRHRKGFYKGCYYDMDEKLWTVNNPDITLKEALDCWWNSIRIEKNDNDNCVYKNAYTCDPIYELDNLSKKDLNRNILIDHWDEDADGYPIAFAKFID